MKTKRKREKGKVKKDTRTPPTTSQEGPGCHPLCPPGALPAARPAPAPAPAGGRQGAAQPRQAAAGGGRRGRLRLRLRLLLRARPHSGFLSGRVSVLSVSSRPRAAVANPISSLRLYYL